MIRFALACASGHEFESWFASSEGFDRLSAAGLVECPHCGSAKVSKALMTPQVARKDRTREPVAAPATNPVAIVSPEEAELRAKLKAIRDEVVAQADNVGDRFADEARKMHDGEIDHRSIYGSATPEEARAMHEDGIEFYPLPVLPDDRN